MFKISSHLFKTADGVKEASGLRSAPCERTHRTLAMLQPEISYREPESEVPFEAPSAAIVLATACKSGALAIEELPWLMLRRSGAA